MIVLTDLFLHRQAVRSFTDKQVEDEKLVACLYAAGLAPSACNTQPYHFYIAKGEKAVKMAEFVKRGNLNQWADEVPCFVVITKEHADLAAAVQMVVHTDFREYDIGLMVENLCLEATEQGLGTCILGCFNEEKIKEEFKIPYSKKIALIIALGYPKEDKIRDKSRKDLNDLITIL